METLIQLQTWLRNAMAEQLSAVSGTGNSMAMTVALASAVLFGFVHAFTPGHGKTLLVSYFLGNGGSLWRGFATAATLALTHVVSAIVLVLAGLGLLQKTLGGAGRAPQLEFTSGLLIAGIGGFLLWRSLRKRAMHKDAASSQAAGLLAFVAGLVPCPLTTFIMVYAVSRGIVMAGLAVSLALALGLVTTLALFAIAAIVSRGAALRLFDRLGDWPGRVARILEIVSAFAVTFFGLVLALNA